MNNNDSVKQASSSSRPSSTSIGININSCFFFILAAAAVINV